MTFQVGQTVYHYTDVDGDDPMTVVRSFVRYTDVVCINDGVDICFLTEDLSTGFLREKL